MRVYILLMLLLGDGRSIVCFYVMYLYVRLFYGGLNLLLLLWYSLEKSRKKWFGGL